MSPGWWAGASLALLVLVTGTGSGFRLRSYVLPPPLAGGRSDATSRRRPAPRTAASVAELAGLDVPASLALELRSGRDLSAALTAVAAEHSGHPELAARLQAAARSAATGTPVGPALSPGTDPLALALEATAVCCDVSVSAGLPLAEVLDAITEEARGRSVLVGRAKAELAAARSTSIVLGCLPLIGLAMGQLLGARPVHVLLATGWGFGCLLGALLLTGTGVVWSRAIVAAATRSLP